MSLSLTPPPRKPSLGGGKHLTGAASSLNSPPLSPPVSRRPRVNTTIAATAIQEHNNELEEEENRAFDLALARLLNEKTTLQDDACSSHSNTNSHHSNCPYNPNNTNNSTHDLERPARPLSIASASSLSSSFSGSMNRRVSQATTVNSNSNSGGLGGASERTCCVHCSAANATTVGATTTSTYSTQLPSPISGELEAIVSPSKSTSSTLSCCSARLRSDSVCSGCIEAEGLLGATALTAKSLAALNNESQPNHHHHCHHHHHHHTGNGQQQGQLNIFSTYPYTHRNSLHLYEDQSELTTPLEVLQNILPMQIRCRLSYHLDECWLVEFSPTGEYLASSGADNCVMLWGDLMTPHPKIVKSLTIERSATSMKWSPNCKYLAINQGRNTSQESYSDYYIIVMDIETAEPVAKILHPSAARSAVGIGWFPDSERFLTVSVDGLFCIWNLRGELTWTYQYDKGQIFNMYMVPGHEMAMFSTVEFQVVIIDLSPNVADEHRARTLDNLSSQVVSFVFRRDNIVAASVKADLDLPRPAHILLYNWQTMTYLRTLEADTYVDKEFVIVPSFIGPEEEILVSGSENGLLHAWDVQSGELIQTIEGHSKHVGGVTGNRAEPGMMVTCSDDNHIIVWVTKELGRRLEQMDQEYLKQQTVSLPPVNLGKGW
ncbi:hypothetical protein BGW42_003695 [Actinomortierella wolfii]|nr:hypothetical protein BGW42_003695 [Actinomortierella wolfii]